ncbi:DNA mismatch repair endonuclease MutH [Thalassotalea litorea]|uniref:DNA mismatch repair endonuclease MutH n=1 Tax=Thalassotalea litorea TaxID=2020715 RepID=UPI003735206F
MLTPESENQLMQSALRLSGMTLGDLANNLNIAVPENLNKEKGWIGLLLERALGASAGSKPLPDFPELGIELKTLPIDRNAKVLETTFVSVAPLTGMSGVTWHTSHVKHKMAKVLWVPIISERQLPVAERVICTPFMWQPNPKEEALLQADWQELTDMIVLGEVEKINGKYGEVLQLRPKAANSKAKTNAFDKNGRPFQTLPRGFYLKTAFTQQLLNRHLRVN